MDINNTNIFDMDDDIEVVNNALQEEISKQNDGTKETGSSLNIIEMLKAMGKSSGNILDDDDTDDDEITASLSADDYHNKSVEYLSNDKYKEALDICMTGLELFPNNVDLISDVIKYASGSGDYETAENYYAILKEKIPVKCWNWRAFTFSFDYKIAEDPIGNEAECRTIIADYKKYIPHEEKAFICESDLEEALGNHERSREVLETAIKTFKNAGQCAARLCNTFLNLGMYEEIVSVADYAIAAAANPQPSFNVEYIAFIQVLAKDAIIHNRFTTSNAVTSEEIDSLIKSYEVLSDSLVVNVRFNSVIATRKMLLNLLKTRL